MMRFAYEESYGKLPQLLRLIRCLSLCLLCLPASALDSEKLISQYAHSAWRVQDGYFRGAPESIAQTTDGYIWVGTDSGIVRFDGARFVPWNPPEGERLGASSIIQLLGSADGSLWVGSQENGLFRWHHGRLTPYALPGHLGSIIALQEEHNESIWVGLYEVRNDSGGVCEVLDQRLRCYGQSSGIPPTCCSTLAADTAGNIWMATEKEVLHWRPRASSAEVKAVVTSHGTRNVANAIAITSENSAWIGNPTPGRDRGLQHLLHGRLVPLTHATWNSSSVGVYALLWDRHQTLWVGTAGGGIYRISDTKLEHFGAAEGLSGDRITNLFEDREGDVWVTTTQGIDCFRELAVTTFSAREGISEVSSDTVLASRQGAIWAGGESGLDTLSQGRISSLRTGRGLPGYQVTSLLEDHVGRLWVGIDSTMSILKNGHFTQIKRPDGSQLGSVVGITEDIDHDVWAEISGTPRELLRIRDLEVREVFPAPQMPAARKVAADPEGGIWLGLMNGDMARYRGGKLETFHFHYPVNSLLDDIWVNQIGVNPDGSVLGATGFGLIGWYQGTQQILTRRNGLPCDAINAFIRDGGALWLYTQCGLVRIADEELKRWWGDAKAMLRTRTFDAIDGVQAGLASFQGAARDTDGKLWFANASAVQMIDPAHLPINAIPPPVHVEEITADRKTFQPGTDLRFPPLTRDVSIRYTALSFVAPQKVRFRYRLEGQDTAWQDAGTRREAFYTNLGPGNYRFRVLACNNDGLWNEAGDSLTFWIAAAYYQTTWFKLACAAAIGCGAWLFYLLRLNQATERVQQRLGARLEERERIARELHDTLLQGFQGLMLRFQAVLKTTMSDPGSAHQMMEKALDRADGVLAEGRSRVRDLREEGLAGSELSEALTRYGEELSIDHTARFSLSVLGSLRPLDPTVFNEAARISREALTNAFKHGNASNIEAELTYGGSSVCLRIRDNGAGIDPLVVNGGKAGHWGLSGMRERAQKIGAQLSIWSQSGAGTEIELTIPARVAYPRTGKPALWARVLSGPVGSKKGKRP